MICCAPQEEFKPLAKWWKEALGAGAVESVKVSRRLSATPCVVVASKVGFICRFVVSTAC